MKTNNSIASIDMLLLATVHGGGNEDTSANLTVKTAAGEVGAGFSRKTEESRSLLLECYAAADKTSMGPWGRDEAKHERLLDRCDKNFGPARVGDPL
jgi:hypothetical protein